jgi:hypothetical protein
MFRAWMRCGVPFQDLGDARKNADALEAGFLRMP